MKKALLLAAGLLLCAAPAWARPLAGVYSLSRPGVTLTLVIQEGPDHTLTGRLSSSSGASYTLQGRAQGGVGQGTLTSAGGGSFFEARPEGNNLILSLISPDANGRPDPGQVRRLVLARRTAPPTQPQPQPPTGNVGVIGGTAPLPQAQARPQAPPAATAAPSTPTAAARPGPGEIGHAQWGFAFRPPAGWQHRLLERGVLLERGQKPGIILVLPHLLAGLNQVQAEMAQGTNEGNTHMSLTGSLRREGQAALAGDYQGFWEGHPARGLAIGTLSPHGGGAMVIAVASPDQFGPALTGPAQAIASSLRYFTVDDSVLKQQLAGYWWRYSGNPAISHESIIQLAADGTYRDRHENAANVANRDAQGHVTSQYLGHGQQAKRGRWTPRGTREQGVIFVTRAGGSSLEISYRVKPSRPQGYSSYYFNGRLHHRVTAKQLRDLGY